MQERNINVQELRSAISSPDSTMRTFEGRVKVRKKLANGKIIQVIYYKEDVRGTNDYFIITAYYIDV
jgi:hypothetical protein